MKRSSFLFVTFFILLIQPFYSQNTPHKPDTKADSLRKELSLATSDSARVRHMYNLGRELFVNRIPFWDSLILNARKCGMVLYESRSYNILGLVYKLQGEHEKTIACLEKSVKLAETEGSKTDMLNPLINLGDYYVRRNDTKKALTYCFRALKLAEETDNKKKLSKINYFIGLCYFYMGDFQKALDISLANLKINQELKNDAEIAGALLSVGNNYAQMKDTQNTCTYYLQCKKYSDMFGKSSLGIEINNSIGSAYILAGQMDSAYKYSYKAFTIAKEMGKKQAFASTMAMLAKISLERGDLKAARQLCLEALDIAKEIDFMLQIPDLALTLKKIYLKEKNYKGALEAYELYITNRDSLYSEATRKQALEKEFSYNLEKKESENKLLSQQNQIQSLELTEKNYFMAGLGGTLLLLFIITYLFTRQNKLKNEQKHAQLEQKLLLSQMNPHFIFNSLQAIQNFILKHNEKEAVKYLSSFAAITRNVLENSRMELIPLKKEIGLLENYLQLQQLRFKNRFEYTIELDESIDIENTLLPPMMAQPFIENAVEHGFHSLESEGKIRISYTLKNDELLMEITDNGSGMKDGFAATKKHQSLAMEITRERILLMNKKRKEKKAAFTIAEAFPSQERKGVKIQFHLPLILQY